MSAAVLKSPAPRCVASGWVTSSSLPPLPTSWYFKGVPSRLGYLLDIAPKDLEKVIYFAAYMVTDVDEEGRSEAMPELRGELDLELKEIENQMHVDINERAEEMERELEAAEAENASAKEKKAIKDGRGEKDQVNIRKSAEAERDHVEEVSGPLQC